MQGNRRRSPKQASWSLPKRKLRFRRGKESESGKGASKSPKKSFLKCPEPSSLLYLFAMLLVIVVVTASFVFHLHVRFEGVRLGYETSKARAERSQLLVERRELRLELASLKAPERVELEAREKLSMEVPDHGQIVVIGKRPKEVLASGGAR